MQPAWVHIIKVAAVIFFETCDVIVAAGGSRDLTMKTFVEIGFTIGIGVMEACDLIAAEDEDLTVSNFESEGLEQPGGKPMPA